MLLTRGSRGLPEHSFPDWGHGGGHADCSELTDGHCFLPVTAGTFLVYYTWFVKTCPFPGVGHLSIIDKIREMALEKAQ